MFLGSIRVWRRTTGISNNEFVVERALLADQLTKQVNDSLVNSSVVT